MIIGNLEQSVDFKLLFWLYTGAIFLLVVLPLNSVRDLNNITILQLRGDYFFHIVVFLPWAFFRPVFGYTGWSWGLLGLLFAAGSEGIQYLLPYRAYNVNDLLANMLGVLVGLLLALLFYTFVKPKPQRTG